MKNLIACLVLMSAMGVSVARAESAKLQIGANVLPCVSHEGQRLCPKNVDLSEVTIDFKEVATTIPGAQALAGEWSTDQYLDGEHFEFKVGLSKLKLSDGRTFYTVAGSLLRNDQALSEQRSEFSGILDNLNSLTLGSSPVELGYGVYKPLLQVRFRDIYGGERKAQDKR